MSRNVQTDPKPKEPLIQKSILFSKSSYKRRPYDLGKVISSAQVDITGSRSCDINEILGVSSKPVAGSLVAPEINCKMSSRATHLPSK